jgi:hypothetical protein
MPHGELASQLGDLVVVLYVVDLAWVVFASASSSRKA